MNFGFVINNEAGLLTALIGGIFALIVAKITISATFKQIKKQFEHKIIYEGLKDFQSKLYLFSSGLGDLSVEVLNLKYFLKSQNNPFVNKGDLSKYRFDTWKKFSDVHIAMQKTYVDYLVSFETHEILFLGLRKMQSLFVEEMKTKLEQKFMDFSDSIFPEMSGRQSSLTQRQQEKEIDLFYERVSNLQVYLQDIRVELQNETLGKILGKTVERRKPVIKDKSLKVLTKKGWLSKKV